MVLFVVIHPKMLNGRVLSSYLHIGVRSSALRRLWAGFIFGLLVCTSAYSQTLSGTLTGINTLNDTTTFAVQDQATLNTHLGNNNIFEVPKNSQPQAGKVNVLQM